MDTSKKITKILIANRGEIALRIQATCKTLAIQTIAIYTEEDKSLSYIYHADEAYELPQNGPAGYLDQESIVQIAKNAGADAIHPGYGFLSENGGFAQRVIDADLAWIGPTPQNIRLLADKAKVRNIMQKAGIPTITGETFDAINFYSLGEAKEAAKKIGFPVLIKCAHGGGGKGMRCVKDIDQFDSCWQLVISESENLFNSKIIIVEKQIENPRHIEVQIAGDGKNYIHIFERECSLQRRHQKIIEESPSNFIKKETKEKLYQAAITAASTVNYKNIGTVEFLVDKDENFYFLEINTRLQVEHSVTELTTSIDLVALQIQLAEQNKLVYQQHEIKQFGHAIECRIYAEDPQQNFMPSSGKIKNLVLPNFPFLRTDHDLQEEIEITPFFDPMLLKFTTTGFSRNIAIKNMLTTLQSTNIFGVETNISFLKKMIASDEFKTGGIHTQLLQNKEFLASLDTSPFALRASGDTRDERRILDEKSSLTDDQIKKLIDAIKTELSQKNRSQSTKTNQWKNQQWK